MKKKLKYFLLILASIFFQSNVFALNQESIQEELDLLETEGIIPHADIYKIFKPDDNVVVIRIIFANDEFVNNLTDLDIERIWKPLFEISKQDLERPLGSVIIEAPMPASDPLQFFPLPAFLKTIPAPEPKPWESRRGPVINPTDNPSQSKGALSGKVIYLSQCHGFYWNSDFESWRTQRGNYFAIVEDLVNPEGANQFLIQYFLNAGAFVFPVREFDLNKNMVIVDNEDLAKSPDNGIYEESGEKWADSTIKGFKNGIAPYKGEINPFKEGSNRYVHIVSGNPTAIAKWTPNIPENGFYNVYVSYSAHESRASDTHYIVRHKGGETHIKIDQRRHGSTWVYVGNFYFEKGMDADKGSVVLANDSKDTGNIVVSADAVRFGGGMGDIVRGTGSGPGDSPVSNRPRWEECCRYYAQFSGAPADSVYNTAGADNGDDVSCRSRYAAWQNETGEDAVYISWHTNAFDGTAHYTSSYIYGNTDPGCCYEPSATKGSIELVQFLHNEIVLDIQMGYDPEWKEHGKGIYTAWFGELNPKYNPEMPSALIEVAFHDNEKDASYIKDPQFKLIVARAFYQGVVKYFANRDKIPVHLLPEPPENVYIQATGNNQVKISWTANQENIEGLSGDPPTSYKVYTSKDGLSFDNGVDSSETELILKDLEPFSIIYAKVTAVNEGGESFSSPVVGTMVLPSDVKADVLVVGSFDRLGSTQLVKDDQSAWGNDIVDRMFLKQMNTYNYIVQHGDALIKSGIAFDSAWHDAVSNELVDLNNYKLVFWAAGEESTKDETFSANEQKIVEEYLKNGKGLVVSGAEVLWDLDFKGTDTDISFAHDILKTGYDDDDAETYVVEGITGNKYTGELEEIYFDNGTHGTYNVDYPDLLLPLNESEPFLNYFPMGIAGTFYKGDDYSVIVLGFPFETVYDPNQAEQLMKAILKAMGGDYTGINDEPEPEPDEIMEEFQEEIIVEEEETSFEIEEPSIDLLIDLLIPDEDITTEEKPDDEIELSDEATKRKNGNCSCNITSSPRIKAGYLIIIIILTLFFYFYKSENAWIKKAKLSDAFKSLRKIL